MRWKVLENGIEVAAVAIYDMAEDMASCVVDNGAVVDALSGQVVYTEKNGWADGFDWQDASRQGSDWLEANRSVGV